VPHHQVSNTHSVPHTTSLPTPISRPLWRGITTTLSIIPPPFRTERPKPNHGRSVFGILAQPPPPGFALANVQPPRRLRVINRHPPPPIITLRRCFTRHARNRATKARFSGFWPKPHHPASRWRTPSPAASTFSFNRTHHLLGLHHTTVLYGTPETEPRRLGFWVFGPTPAPWPRVSERAVPQLPPCHLPTPTTSLHHPMLPFYMAHRKPRDGCTFSVFSPNPPLRFGLVNAQPHCPHLIHPRPPQHHSALPFHTACPKSSTPARFRVFKFFNYFLIDYFPQS
jgi:hypothetical protein